jgi:hypothetical protein
MSYEIPHATVSPRILKLSNRIMNSDIAVDGVKRQDVISILCPTLMYGMSGLSVPAGPGILPAKF